MSTSIVEVVTQYQEGLADLKINSKPIITNLSIIAGEILKEHGEAGASTIAALIEKHIASVRQIAPSCFLGFPTPPLVNQQL